MWWHGLTRSGRTLAASVATLLFLAGSNYCLITVLAGGTMSCLTAPGASAGRTSHCCHALPGSTADAETPAGDSSPCCVTAAPVASCQVQKADAGDTFVAVMITGSVLAAMPAATGFGSVPVQKPPPELHRASRHSGRAPPLA